MRNIRSLVKECVLNVLKENLQTSPDSSNKPQSKPVAPKTIQVLQKWMEGGSRDAAKRLIDYILKRRLGLGTDDLADTATFANGLDSVSEALDVQDWRGAIDIAKDTADEMIADEGGDGMEEGFEPTSVGPNPDASEGNSVYDPYASMNAKMRQMEDNSKWEAEGRCGQCGTPGSKCNCKILKRVQAYIALKDKIKELESSSPNSPELKNLLDKKNEEEPWVRNILQQAGYGHKPRPYLRENMGRYAQLAGATDLKETLELTATGQEDDWSRPVYRDKQGRIYVDVNLGKGTPSIHTVTDDGEPLSPVRDFTISGTTPTSSELEAY